MTREFSASSDLPHTFFRLTDDARAALRDIAPVVMGRIDELLDRFYGHLMQWPIARERLENPQSRERLKQQQRAHWELLFRGDINGDYLAHCAAVGQAHQRIQLPPFWWIGAYSHLLGDMTRLVAGQFRLNGEKRAQALTALISAVMYDMAATMAVYNDAHETATIREKLGSFADNLLTHTVDLAIVINEAATANAGMVNELRAMDKTAQHVAASTEAMVSSVSELSSRSHEVATHARDASQSALHGRDVAGRAVASMAEISEAVSAAAQRVNELSSASERIGDIIASIEAIAKQTNLLALNATIEAARAGEAGKGFAVVASEVKSLSRQTATATEDIRSRIDELRAEMMAIIRTMEDSVRAVSEGQTIIRDVSERMGEVGSLVEHASDGMTDIAAILERQTEASGAVAEGIATMADDATENARSIMRTVNAMQNVEQLIAGQIDGMAEHDIPNKIIRMARADHVIWKKRLADMLVGIKSLDPNELSSHEQCRLGRWYYGPSSLGLRDHPLFKALEEPHRQVHAHGIAAVSYFNLGNREAAQTEMERVTEASHQVLHLLEELEKAAPFATTQTARSAGF